MNRKQITIRLFTALIPLITLFSCLQPTPPRYADGMLRSVPEDQGVSSHSILDFIEEIDRQEVELHSFMLIRHDRVLAEGYWSPYKADINHVMYSVSKTFTSAAIGFAVKEKRLKVDDKVISFFPGELPEKVSPNLEKLTVKHLLTMTVGHAEQPVSFWGEDNWVKSFLAVPVVYEPGKTFSYNSYASHMLSAIIQQVSGESLFDYLTPRLFEPLGIKDISWETDPRGITCGGWGLRIKTADMAKLGKLYLQKGKWGKKQLLPESWIKESTAVHIYQIEEPTFEQEMYDEAAQGYGYQIWRSTHNAYRADGAYGQYILIMPEQDALLITTAKASDMRKILSLFWEHLFPGVMDQMIRKNEAAKEALISKTVSLRMKPPFVTSPDEFIRKNTTYTYETEANGLNVQEVSFTFDETGGCLFAIRSDEVSYSFDFGLDTWSWGETDKNSPYFLNEGRNPQGISPYSVAGYGSWTGKDELSLHLRYLTDTEYETYVCTFTDTRVEISAANSAQPGETILHGSERRFARQ